MRTGASPAGSVSIFPAGDHGFRDQTERSLASVAGGRIPDVAMVAAVEALLRESYPLASVSRRQSVTTPGLDVFRDGDTLDVQLVLRMKAGDLTAAGRLYDRHAALVYSIAARTTADRELARTAVVKTFRASKIGRIDQAPVRVSLARTARSISASLARPPRESANDLGVLAVDLMINHALTATQVELVLQLDRGEVARLANRMLSARTVPVTGSGWGDG